MFRQLQGTGLLAFGGRIASGLPLHQVVAQVYRRLGPLMKLAALLERYTENPGLLPGSPYLHNLAQWSTPTPAGGYSSSQTRVSLHDLLVTYGSAWRLLDTGRPALTNRLFRGALAVLVESRDPVAAVRYLLDLSEAGLALGEGVFQEALARLYSIALYYEPSALPSATSLPDLAAVEREEVSSALAPWEKVENHLLEGAAGREVIESNWGALLSFLTGALSQEARRTENAPDCGAFLSGQAKLLAITASLRTLQRYGRDEPSVGAAAVYSFASEVRADAGACALRSSSHCAWEGNDCDLGYFESFWHMFQMNFGAQWVNRIRKTRVLLPRRLIPYASSLFPLDGSQPSPIDLPAEWKFFPIEYAPSLCALNDLDPDRVRRGWMALPADIDWERLEAELVQQDQGRPVIERVLVKLRSGLAPERDALSPERLALDGESRAVLQAVHASSARNELREQLVPLIRRFEEVPKEEWTPLLERLEEWNELYPWSPIVLQERVVRLDQAGHPDRALDLIEAAVLIEPGRPALWRSLGAVYARLGWEREAAACRGIRAFIEEET